MARAKKPAKLIALEGRNHMTKAELEHREEQEKKTMTGEKMVAWPEVWNDPLARKEFNRLRKLLRIIEKDDALYESIMNRYALLHSECAQNEKHITRILGEQEKLAESWNSGEIDADDYFKHQAQLERNLQTWDSKLMEKRRMMLQIEKENVMTILASTRTIPQKPKEEKAKSVMGAYLGKRAKG